MNTQEMDDHMDSLLENGDLAGIRKAAKDDPDLIARGWRDGTVPWVKSAMLFGTYTETVPLLLELDADINATNKGRENEDAILSALAGSRYEELKFLLEHGAIPNKQHVVWSAVTGLKDQLAMVKLVEQYGADIHEVDEGGFSGRFANPLSLAKDYGHEDVVEYLESRGCVMPPSDNEELLTEANAPSQSIIDHFTASLAQSEKISLIEIVPSGIPIAIHAIPANEHHPFVTLFTTGMSEYPMNVPEEAEEYSRAELYIQLPADWKYREYEDPNWGWPQQWLRSMAQHPQQHDTWLGGPVALVANEDPPQPLAPNTQFTTLLLLADQSLTNEAGEKIWIYRMTPLYTEERQLEIDQGIPALLNAFDAHDIPMIVDMNRKNAATG